VKGVVLAGGRGTRLQPLTLAVSKQLLPIHDKPMIFYPVSVLMLAGIREILIITTPQDQAAYEALLGDGESYGCRFSYEIQESPAGVADALLLAKGFLAGDDVCLILGDNIFYGAGFGKLLRSIEVGSDDAVVFATRVQDPENYGVVTFSDEGEVLSVEEKPSRPTSNLVVPGIYFYGAEVVKRAGELKPSARGELEISDLNQVYLEDGKLRVIELNRGVAWFDTGTFASLNRASTFVRMVEERQGLKIACLEEVAFYMGYISKESVKAAAQRFANSEYGDYLEKL